MAASAASDDGSYDIPETYLKLDEIAAPQVAERNTQNRQFLEGSPSESLRSASPRRFSKASIEDRVQSHIPRPDSEALPWGIAELAVLPPVLPDAIDHDAETKTEAGESIWGSPILKRASRHATQLYFISYLVLFSILGTLARLGLQDLNSYPGAPVSASVLWANFAGSLIMGFFNEDRKLFIEGWGRKKPEQRRRPFFKRDKELSNHSIRYSRTAKVGAPFATSQAAQMFPARLVDATPTQTRRPPSMTTATPSMFTDPCSSAEGKKQHIAVKKSIPLYAGITVGFCGSLTSFSSFQRDVFLSLSNSTTSPGASSPMPRSGGFSFLALLGTLILTPILSLGALQFGAHLALALEEFTPTLPYRFTRRIVDRVAVVLAWGCWLGAVLMAIFPPANHWRGDAVFAIIFAPLGCLARFYASLFLNQRIPSFPLGTFVVNILGTVFEAGFYDIQHVPLATAMGSIGGGRIGCQLLQGAQDGFCGCLTTVSTWVLELHGLRRTHAYFYGASSLVAGLIATLVVMGPVRWTVGFAATACLT